MTRLIDADKLNEDLHKKFHEYDREDGRCTELNVYVCDGIDFAMGVVNEQPTVEARPKGKWILKETEYDAGGTLYECTNCHHSDVHAECVEVPFCWYCGADMRGDTYETN